MNLKEKTAFFACDVEGTISGNLYSGEDWPLALKSYMELPILLELIREKTNADTLLFSFFSDSNECTVRDALTKIAPYFEGTKIKLGFQFSGEKNMDDEGNVIGDYPIAREDKVIKITNVVKGLQAEKEITWVGFADDTRIQVPTEEKLKSELPNLPVKAFRPLEIVGLVQNLSDYLGIPLAEIDKQLPPENEWLDFNNPGPNNTGKNTL